MSSGQHLPRRGGDERDPADRARLPRQKGGDCSYGAAKSGFRELVGAIRSTRSSRGCSAARTVLLAEKGRTRVRVVLGRARVHRDDRCRWATTMSSRRRGGKAHRGVRDDVRPGFGGGGARSVRRRSEAEGARRRPRRRRRWSFSERSSARLDAILRRFGARRPLGRAAAPRLINSLHTSPIHRIALPFGRRAPSASGDREDASPAARATGAAIRK
jgi:hypothetical protein